jgi:predicted CopG family antitoxin
MQGKLPLPPGEGWGEGIKKGNGFDKGLSMQTVQISDNAVAQLQDLAAQEHISSSDLIERLIAKHSVELIKTRELHSFFKTKKQD